MNEEERKERAELHDNHLYLFFFIYYMGIGNRLEQKIIPVKDINFIIDRVGVRGGDHGFEIIGFEKSTFDDKYYSVQSFGRGSLHILDDIKKLLPSVKVETKIV